MNLLVDSVSLVDVASEIVETMSGEEASVEFELFSKAVIFAVLLFSVLEIVYGS